MQSRNNPSFRAAGVARYGACGICLLGLAILMVFGGIAITAIGFTFCAPHAEGSTFDTPFFQNARRDCYESNGAMRVAGPILLTIGLVLVIAGVCTICWAQKERQAAFRRGQTGVSGPIVSGSGPANTYMGAQGPGTQPLVYPTTNVGPPPQHSATAKDPAYPGGPYQASTPVYPPPAAVPSAPVDTPYPGQSYPANRNPGQAPPPPYEAAVNENSKLNEYK